MNLSTAMRTPFDEKNQEGSKSRVRYFIKVRERLKIKGGPRAPQKKGAFGRKLQWVPIASGKGVEFQPVILRLPGPELSFRSVLISCSHFQREEGREENDLRSFLNSPGVQEAT
ncbi:MAG: hypothetical protein NTZ74_14565 [Chloroflexi bacterium]|nr:hypothetical protein [Chloroflexota bacterium]